MRAVLGAAFVLISLSAQGQQPTPSEPPPRDAAHDPGAAMSASPVVQISHLHIILTRKNDRMVVSQIFMLSPTGTEGGRQSSPYAIRVPPGAVGFRTTEEDREHLVFRTDRVIVRRPITAEETRVAFSFELPIRDGTMRLTQQLDGTIGTCQIVSTWTHGDVSLTGRGFEPAVFQRLSSGLTGLLLTGQNISGANLQLELSGLEDGASAALRRATLFLSLLFLGGGFAWWLRRRFGAGNRSADPEDNEK